MRKSAKMTKFVDFSVFDHFTLIWARFRYCLENIHFCLVGCRVGSFYVIIYQNTGKKPTISDVKKGSILQKCEKWRNLSVLVLFLIFRVEKKRAIGPRALSVHPGIIGGRDSVVFILGGSWWCFLLCPEGRLQLVLFYYVATWRLRSVGIFFLPRSILPFWEWWGSNVGFIRGEIRPSFHCESFRRK